MLEEVELFVARARPEIIAMHNERLFLFVARFVDDGDAALLSERRIRQHHFVFAVLAGERVFHHHGDVRGVAADAVEHEIHAAESRDAIDQLDAAKLLGVKERELFLIELVVIANEVVRDEKETAGAARRIADRFVRLWLHHMDECADERTRSEVLACAAFHVLGVLLQKPFVGVAFDVGIEGRPFFLVDQVSDQAAQLRRVLDFALRLAKDDADQSWFFAEFFERMTIMNLQFISVALQQLRPRILRRNRRLFVERRAALLVRHFEEEQEC